LAAVASAAAVAVGGVRDAAGIGVVVGEADGRVILISSSDEKLEKARLLGADTGMNYQTTPDWDTRVLALTGGVGVDRVIEVGGAGTLARSINAVRDEGQISLIGVLAGWAQEVSVAPLIAKNAISRA
jgi:NADPH:quinone reductase-like Zn-dependent oxidoreductase